MIGGAVVAGITYYATPKYTRVGYQPTQPVEYNHEFHAGQLGLDCRYCHHGADKSSHANIPGANVCMSCHKNVKADSPSLNQSVTPTLVRTPIKMVNFPTVKTKMVTDCLLQDLQFLGFESTKHLTMFTSTMPFM